MSRQTETFPSIGTNGMASVQKDVTRPVQRRRTSRLGGDPRGDTGGNALATTDLTAPSLPAEGSHSAHPKDRGRKRKKAKNLVRRFRRASLKHTWLIPLILTATILFLYFISPGEHNPLHAAIFLSYPNPPLNERTNTLPAHIGNVTQYGKGPRDIAFVAFYTIVLLFTREFLMLRLIRPMAIRLGIRGKGKIARFMEQSYFAIYFTFIGPYGVWLMSRTPVWYFNVAGMYEGFPHRAHEAYFKAYYLLQASFWVLQALVLLLQLEKPRKDFRELVLHHVITVALIALSYRFHFTYMGIAVYITHDVSDFFIATSKILNYLDSIATGPYYIMFMCIWAYLRHYINLRILYSLLPFDLPYLGKANQFMTVGPYAYKWSDVDFPNQQYKCFVSQPITFFLLASLQIVNLLWFFLLCRILYRYAFKGVQKDERSDDEEEREEVEQGDVKTLNGSVISQEKNVDNVEAVTVGNGHVSTADDDRKATLRKR